jgi:hypothetical protein
VPTIISINRKGKYLQERKRQIKEKPKKKKERIKRKG